MPRPIPADRVAAIRAEVGKYPAGATLVEVAVGLSPIPRVRNLQRWVSAMVRDHGLIRVGKTTSLRYKLPPSEAVEALSFRPPKAALGIQILLSQPLAERAPADYRRVILDRYRPNDTYYLPADLRARIAATRDGGAWRQKPAFDAALTSLAARCLWLEGAMEPSRAEQALAALRRRGAVPSWLTQPLTEAEVTAWLSQPEHPGARREAQLLWGVRAGFAALVNAGPAVSVTSALLAQVYQQVTAQLDDSSSAVRLPSSALSRPSASVTAQPLRRAVLTLPDTTYCPPSDPNVIDPCFEQVLRVAAAITDPVERAFFLLVHLLYLLPFGTLNATMALLTMNVPLLTAGLPPITFAGVAPTDLLAGIRGVWELGRSDLLADAFGAGLRVTAQP